MFETWGWEVNDTHPDPQWGTYTGRESLLGIPAASVKNYP